MGKQLLNIPVFGRVCLVDDDGDQVELKLSAANQYQLECVLWHDMGIVTHASLRETLKDALHRHGTTLLEAEESLCTVMDTITDTIIDWAELAVITALAADGKDTSDGWRARRYRRARDHAATALESAAARAVTAVRTAGKDGGEND